MKMKKALMILLAVLLACGVLSAGSFAEEPVLFQYEVQEDGTATKPSGTYTAADMASINSTTKEEAVRVIL